MKIWNFVDENEQQKAEVLEKYKQNPPDVYGHGHTEYLQNVVDSILDKKSALVDGLSGKKSLEILSAIYESIETGEEVVINFVTKKCRLGFGELTNE